MPEFEPFPQETENQKLELKSQNSIGGWAFLVAQLAKNSPAMWETRDRSLAWEDPLEKGKATHSNTLAWRIPKTVQSMGSKQLDTTEQFSL